MLVDIDPEVPDQLRFVLSPSRTPATENFIQVRLQLSQFVIRLLLSLKSHTASQLLQQEDDASPSICE